MPTDIAPTPNIVPFLRYEDAPAAIDWLVRAFGFEKVTLIEGEGGSIEHAVLRLGSGMIMVSSLRGNAPASRARPDMCDGLYVVINDPDARFDRAKAAGAEIVMGLTDQDYGSREFMLRDPEGVIWSFGTYRPGSH